MNKDIVVKAHGVKKNYDNSYALNGIDLEVTSGQILGFLGPNGAGKSTCLLYTSPSPRDRQKSRMPSSA